MKKIAYLQMFKNEKSHAWYLGTRKLMTSLIQNHLTPESKILDTGCGTGGTLVFLKDRGYKNIYGIDNSRYAIQLCRKRKIENVKLGNINKIPYKNNVFDAVICMDVLYHKGVNPGKAVKEIYRVLKIGGIYYSQEPAYTWLKSRHDIAIETSTRFTKEKLIKIISSEGFNRIKVTYFNLIFFAPIVLVRLKNILIKPRKIDSDVKKLPKFLNLALLFALRLESVAIKYFNLPFGVSVISLWRK